MEINIFWELSFSEVIDYMDSYGRRQKQEMKQRLAEKHFLARDIAQFVGIALAGSDGQEPAQLWDFFPKLFSEEKCETEREIQNNKTAVYKAQMNDFAYRHNYARNGGEGKRKE